MIKTVLVFICISVVIEAVPSINEEWKSFKTRHGKSYTHPSEERFRLGVYMSNKQMIEEHNLNYKAGLTSYEMEMNHFADKLPEEISAELNGFNRSGELLQRKPGLMFSRQDGVMLPSSVDWRQKGAVTPVKDQGQCGGCWAFSATGSLEGQLFLKTGKLVSLSEQNLIDCGTSYGTHGCNGGVMDSAFYYIMRIGGIDSEESYPYEGKEMECRYKSSESAATVSGYVDVPHNEEALKEAVATVGPISIGINAGLKTFGFYKQGVFDDKTCDPATLNHGVLLVGYGTENGQDYWLVKNSWNESWGDEGYVKIARNQGNLCGVASMGSYPVL